MYMQKLFAAVGVFAVLVILGGAAYRVLTPPVPAAAPRGVPKSISELPITQHFSMFIGPVGPLIGMPPNAPWGVTLPSDTGLAIAQLNTIPETPSGWSATHVIRCDGMDVWKGRVASSSSGGSDWKPFVFSPPIIIPPGSQLEIFLANIGKPSASNLTIGGYFLTEADLGM